MIACVSSANSFAQVVPAANDTVTVTSDPTTWLVQQSDDAVDIPAGADGVTINNGALGQIVSETGTAIQTAADTEINNDGLISGGFNGVNFENGLGSGSLTNSSTGVISSDSRGVNIGGPVALTNAGQILGTGDQRNGTVYSDSAAQDFSIDNSGTIDAGVGNQGAGFSAELSDAGTNFSIDNSGTIAGRGDAGAGVATAGDGIRLERTRVGGALDGSTTGSFTGSITNSGDITSEGANGTVGGFRAVNGVDFQGTLDNSGTISGTQNGVYFGNATPAGGGNHTDGVVNNSGTISSDSRALNIDGTGLTVNNSGDIVGTGDQRNGTAYADSTAQDFTLNNTSTGTIDAGVGNQGAGFSAELSEAGNDFTINNAGTIAGRGNAGAGVATAGDGIRLERTRVDGALDGTTTGLFTGSITNSGDVTSDGANGTVGGFRAVNGVDFQGTLDNSGTISGTQNGVYFGNATPAGGGDHTDGVVNNSGTISSDSRALNIDGTGLTVNNSGDIVGTGDQRNGTVYADSTAQDFSLNNFGNIDAGVGNLGAGFSAELSATGNNFLITNSGTIAGRGDAGAGATTAGDGIRLERTRVDGALDGTTTGLFTGTINNTGDITSEGANGTVAGFRAVNGVDFQGALNNSGTISGTQNGVYFGNPTPAGGGDHTGGVVNNSGTISSDSRALNIDGTGLTVNNSGDIVGTGDQRNGTAYADSTAQDFSLNNSGSIDAGVGNLGAGFSAELSATGNNFSITNSGTIAGRGDAGAGATTAGDGIRLERTRVDGALDASTTGLFTGTITNTGDITSEGTTGTVAGFRAVNGVSFQGTLNNVGTISGTQNGVYFGNAVAAGGADHTGGVVNNSGTISSDSRAFNIDGNGLTVNNTGDILATGRQRNGTLYVDGTANNFEIRNSGSIDARGGAGSGVSIQVGATQTGSLTNSGVIAGSGELSDDAGVRFFTNEASATITGDIINQAGGVISGGEASQAILFGENVTFDGSLFNAGQIIGGVDLGSGSLTLSDTSILSLEISSLTDFDTVFAEEILFDGTLELLFVDDFVAQEGDTFDLFDFGSDFTSLLDTGFASGSFDTILANGFVFDTSSLLSSGSISVASVAAIPEPSSIAVLAFGIAGLSLRRRRDA